MCRYRAVSTALGQREYRVAFVGAKVCDFDDSVEPGAAITGIEDSSLQARRRPTRHSQTDSDIACLPSARASDGACVVSAGPASIDVAEVAGGMSGGGGREFLGGVHHEAAPLGDGLVERLAFKDHELGALLAVQGQR